MKDHVRTLAAIASGLVAGVSLVLTLVLSGAFIPPALQVVEARSLENQAGVWELQAQYEKIICLLTLPDGTTPLGAEQICGVTR